MSLGTWICRQRDRPIGEHERRAAFIVISALLIATTLLLAITRADSHRSGPRRETAASAPAPATRLGNTMSEASVEHVAGEFVAGYLAYVYGHAPASHIKGATGGLVRSLKDRAPRVSPSMRASHPRVIALRPATTPAGRVGVTAIVNDGGLVDYSISVFLARQGRLLLVTGLGGA